MPVMMELGMVVMEAIVENRSDGTGLLSADPDQEESSKFFDTCGPGGRMVARGAG
jgi:hypothetical protein